MKKQSTLFLKYIFSIVVISPILVFISTQPSLQGNKTLLAGFNNKNQDENIHSSFEENDESAFPTNPMELINVLRNIEAMNGRTEPSDAIDDALKAFESKDKEDFSLYRESQ